MKAILPASALMSLPALVLAGQLSWEVRTGGGYDSNPLNIVGTQPQALGWTQVMAGWISTTEKGTFALTYLGGAYSFVPESDWSAHQHSLGATYAVGTVAGMAFQIGGRLAGDWNHLTYRAYNYRALEGHLTLRGTLASWTGEGKASLAFRTYPESPAFDFRQLDLVLAGKRQFPSRTTVRAEIHHARRTYITTSIEDLIAGRSHATSHLSQLIAALSQGLTERSGLRMEGWVRLGEGESRWRDDYWQVLDDPLATSGAGGRVQMSWLVPGGLTFRASLGGERMRRAYVANDGAYAKRLDTTARAGVILEGVFPWTVADRPFAWSLEIAGARTRSDDPMYSTGKLTTMLAMRYAW